MNECNLSESSWVINWSPKPMVKKTITKNELALNEVRPLDKNFNDYYFNYRLNAGYRLSQGQNLDYQTDPLF